MKKIVIFIISMMFALTSFGQYSGYFVEKEPLKDTKHNITDGAGCGVGVEYNGNNYNVILNCNIYHWEFMYRCDIDDNKAKGPIGQQYSSVMATYSCMSYLGDYRTTTFSMGLYGGYIIKQLSFGAYLGYEEYSTGETYGNLNHVSNWDEVFSVNDRSHIKFVYGTYIKYHFDKRISLFCSYKFNTEANAYSLGLVFNFMAY